MASDGDVAAAPPVPPVAPTTATAIPPNLFEATSRDDVGGIVHLYASTARDAIVSYAALRRRWGASSRSSGRGGGGDSSAEEKLDEFFQFRRDPSSSPRSSSRRRDGSHYPFDGSSSSSPSSSPRNGRRGRGGASTRNKSPSGATPPAEEMMRELEEIMRCANADDEDGVVAIDDEAAGPVTGRQQHQKTRPSAGPLAAHPSDVAASAGLDPEIYADESLKSALADLSRQEIERVVRESASLLTNARPPSSFALFPRDNAARLRRRERLRDSGGLDAAMDGAEEDERKEAASAADEEDRIDDDGDESPPLFDGSVANATPGGAPAIAVLLGGAAAPGAGGGGGGGSGTLLHLACAVDAPFALAVFLSLGGDASSRHTAFRRAMVHEAACADSPDCLALLLELGKRFGDEMMTDGGGAAKEVESAAPASAPRMAAESSESQRLPRTLFGGWSKRTRSGSKSSSRSSSSSSDMDTDDNADASAVASAKKKKPVAAPPTMSFVATLRNILTLGQAALDGTTTDLEAGRSLMEGVDLPSGAKAALIATCYPLPQRPVAQSTNRGGGCSGRSRSSSRVPSAPPSPAGIFLMPALGLGGPVVLPNLPATVAHYYDQQHRHFHVVPPGPAPNADGHGNTPLHWAAFKNSASCVAVLLAHNVDPNARAEPSGWTPLHDAAYSDAADSLALLVEAGVDVDARANSGATPLCFAAQEDAPGATGLLLEAGADATVRCCGHSGGANMAATQQGGGHQSRFSGYTPLHYCAHYNARAAARVLLDHRQRCAYAYAPLGEAENMLDVPDLNGKLPIHVAVARGSSDVLRELLRGGARVDTASPPKLLLAAVVASRPATPTADVTSPASPQVAASANNPVALAARAHPSPPSSPNHTSTTAAAVAVAATFSSPLRSPQSGTTPTSPSAVVTPVSSPVLRSLIPSRPVNSSKPWNCLTQTAIDECRSLVAATELNWTPERHPLFHPTDRRAVIEVLRVGKRLEQLGTGIFAELWPSVLGFCGRGWFEPEGGGEEGATMNEEEDRKIAAAAGTTATAAHRDDHRLGADDMELTHFRLDE